MTVADERRVKAFEILVAQVRYIPFFWYWNIERLLVYL
jgi:hypothetical protein